MVRGIPSQLCIIRFECMWYIPAWRLFLKNKLKKGSCVNWLGLGSDQRVFGEGRRKVAKYGGYSGKKLAFPGKIAMDFKVKVSMTLILTGVSHALF